eukprot:5467436-Pleurochrysis_carterae.AAC.1
MVATPTPPSYPRPLPSPPPPPAPAGRDGGTRGPWSSRMPPAPPRPPRPPGPRCRCRASQAPSPSVVTPDDRAAARPGSVCRASIA